MVPLPTVEMGELRGVEPMDQVTFYDPQDAIEMVQIMTMCLVYDYCQVFAAMDLESNLFYAVSFLQTYDPRVRLAAHQCAAYRPSWNTLGVEEPMEISIVNLADNSGFFGTLTSSEDPDLLISFAVTAFQIGYAQKPWITWV